MSRVTYKGIDVSAGFRSTRGYPWSKLILEHEEEFSGDITDSVTVFSREHDTSREEENDGNKNSVSTKGVIQLFTRGYFHRGLHTRLKPKQRQTAIAVYGGG